MIEQHVGSSSAPAEWQIVGVPPIGLVGSFVLSAVLIVAAGLLTWWLVKWADRDLRTGKGPRFLYRR